MRIQARRDESGNIVGYSATDDRGAVVHQSNIRSSNGSIQPTPSSQLPGLIDTRTQKPSGGSGEDDTAYLPPNQRLSNSPVDPSQQASEQQGYQQPDTPENFLGQASTDAQSFTESQVQRGGISGVLGRLDQFRNNVTYGAVDAIEDFADFGAAIIDTARGKEVNNDDNFFQPTRALAAPTSSAGNVVSELASFGVGQGAVGKLLGKIPVLAKLAKGKGLVNTIASGAVTGAATDFIKANGEENLYNAVKGTPLETPISNFLAADTDEDSNIWLNKVKEAAGGVPLGIAFDLVGGGLGKALNNLKTEPLVAELEGVKLLMPAPELEANVDKAYTAAKEQVKQELDNHVKERVTEVRLALEGKLDGTEEAGLLNVELSTEGLSSLDKVKQLEEALVEVQDLQISLNGLTEDLQDPETASLPLSSLFDLADEIQVELNTEAKSLAESSKPAVKSNAELTGTEFDRLDSPDTSTNDVKDFSVPDSEDLKDYGGINYKPQIEGDELVTVEVDKVYEDWQNNGLTDLIPGRKEQLDSDLDRAIETGEEFGALNLTYDDSGFDITDGRTRITALKERGVKYAKAKVEDIRPTSQSVNDRAAAFDAEFARLNDTETSTPSVNNVEQPFEPTPERHSQTYRTASAPKTRSVEQIKQDVASRRTKKRISKAKLDINIPAINNDSYKALEADVDAVKGYVSIEEAAEGKQYINVEKLTDSKSVQNVIQQSLDNVPEPFIRESISKPRLLKEARKFWTKHANLSQREQDAAFLLMAGKDGQAPKAVLAARLAVKDLAGQVEKSIEALGDIDFDKATTISQNELMEDFLFKVSRLELYTTSVKNIGKEAGQVLGAAFNFDLSDVNINELLQKASYEELLGRADNNLDGVNSYYQELRGLARTKGGRKKVRQLMVDLKVNAGDLDKELDVLNASKFSAMKKGMKNFEQIALGTRVNGLLSGSVTQLTNLVSGLTNTVYVPLTQIAGSTINYGYHTMRGMTPKAEVDKELIQDSLVQLASIRQYIKDSSNLALIALKTGFNQIENNKQLLGEDAFLDFNRPNTGNPYQDKLLQALGIPSRLLVGGDELVKQLNYRSKVHATAWRDGVRKGKVGKELDEHVSFLVDASLGISPETGVKGLALDPNSLEYSKYITYQTDITKENSDIRNSFMQAFQKIEEVPGLGTFTKVFLPFKKTPLNIMSYTARNTPLAAVSKQWRQDFQAGGELQARAMGELALGTTAMMGFVGFAMDGRLTGRAPKDKNVRQQWMEQGYQPYSFKVGNKWVSYKRVEPFATHLAIVADVVNAASTANQELAPDVEAGVKGALYSFVTATKDKTFFQGVEELVDVLSQLGEPDNERQLTKKMNQLAASFLPYSSALNEQRKAADPVLRETQGLLDELLNKTPGWSESLPARYNWLTGKAISYSANPILNMYPSSSMDKDYVMSNLIKFNVALTPPNEKIKGIKLTTEQYSRLNQISGTVEIGGKTLHQALSDKLQELDLDMAEAELTYIQQNDVAASKTPIAKELRAIRTRYNKASNAYLVSEFPELEQAIYDNLSNEENTKEGIFYRNSPIGEELGYQTSEEFLQRANSADKSVAKKMNNLLETN